MQHVTVKPRASFKHFVLVAQPTKEILWSFGTKRKNISFGLFRSSATSTTSNGTSTDQQQTSTASSPFSSLVRRRTSSVSSSVSPTDSVPENLIEIVPIAHYDSAKHTIKGSYRVTEPGLYVLVFDNTFSVNTSKKLYFFVSVRDLNDSVVSEKKVVEGWILKKGNRKMQGFSRRWMQIDSHGVLTYYKHPGASPRAIVPLSTTAVRVDHDDLSIAIDTGSSIFQLRAENERDLLVWVDAFQMHAPAEKFAVPPNILMRNDSSVSSIPLSETAAENVSRVDRGSDYSKLLASHRSMEKLLLGALEKLMALHDFAEENKFDDQVDRPLSQLTKDVNSLQVVLLAAQKQAAEYSDSTSSTLSRTQAAYRVCLADNNRLRTQLGLPPYSDNELKMHPRFSALALDDTNQSDIASSVRSSIQFFDAIENEGRSDASDNEVQDESRISANVIVEEDDSDQDVLMASVGGKLAASASGTAGATALQLDKLPPSYDLVPVTRRTGLPAPPVSMEGLSVMSILRNNLGKDLSTIAMPIALNEPLNLLQRLAEELEYSELLDAAGNAKDPLERIILISAFAVSGYASTVNRAGRKPFNPLLCETYECIRPDKGFRFISEKVSHHPPVMACYADSANYVFYQDNLVKTKFWGKSMELIPSGIVNVVLPAFKEKFSWSKVTTCMRNVFSANRSLDHYGTMKITSSTSGLTAMITFKEIGYFTTTKNEIVGVVVDASGTEVGWMSGKWDDALYRYEKSNPNNLQVIWRATPPPPHHQQMYGFTQFAVELNELTPDIEKYLPRTDTRFRTDQRLYEMGRIEEAETEKLRLEQKQRETRKRMEAEGLKISPRWFQCDDGQWHYNGGYFENRGQFADSFDIFG